MFDLLYLLVILLLITSPLLLPFLKNGVLDGRSFLIASVMAVVALGMPLIGFGETHTVWKFLLAQTLLFTSFVCVSRIRQRKSLFLQALAGIASNGGWFLAMQVLAGAYLAQKQGVANTESLGLLIAAITGTLIGRLIGVQWMMWVEKRWQVRTDSVGSATLRRLDSKTTTWLTIGLFVCMWSYGVFGWASARDVNIIIALGLIQNAAYTLNTRFANRNHLGWSVVTGLIAGIVFMMHWTFLMGYTQTGGFMPIVLFVPYTIATVYGGNVSTTVSIYLEDFLGLNADAHVTHGESHAGAQWHRTILLVTALLCGGYLVTSGYIFHLLGITAHAITLPFTVLAGTEFERPVALLLGGGVFFINNITQTLSSRAGNRNHAPYHAVTCLFHGIMTFGTGTFVVLNAHFLDLVPVAAFGSAFGQMFAQKWSMKMEAWLVSVMDLPEEKKSSIK